MEEIIGLFTCILPLIFIGQIFPTCPSKKHHVEKHLVQQCLEGILPFFEASRLPQNFRDPVLSSHLLRQEDTGLCEFRAGFGGVDESQEEWSVSQCRLDPGLRVGTNPCQSWRDPSNMHYSLSSIYVKTSMETENYSLGKREKSTEPPIFEGSMFFLKGRTVDSSDSFSPEPPGVTGYSTSKCAEWRPGRCMGTPQEPSLHHQRGLVLLMEEILHQLIGSLSHCL